MTLQDLIANLESEQLSWFDIEAGYPEGYPNDQKFLVDLGGHITHSFWTTPRHWDERMMVIRWYPIPKEIQIDA